jgi:hypothetical protein
MAQRLTLEAVVIDKFSGVFRDMFRQIGLVDEKGRRVHYEGSRLAKEHAKQFQELRKATTETSRTVKELLLPTMAALGVGSITAGAGIAALTKSIISFGETAKQLKFLRQETGLATQNLGALP